MRPQPATRRVDDRTREGVDVRALMRRAADAAADYLDGVGQRPVAATASAAQLRERLLRPVPEVGTEPQRILDELISDTAGGLLGSTGGRFFGWVIGGAVPAALAADWLTSAWDQNAALYACSPAAAIVEEACRAWIIDILGLPRETSMALVTGCQMAHVTALASARGALLSQRGWDVERDGLTGAPRIRLLATRNRHISIDRAARLLGMGTAAVIEPATDDRGRIELGSLERHLAEAGDAPTIAVLQAGDVNTGLFDPLGGAIDLVHEHDGWAHIDGAFGVWAAASPQHAAMLDGFERADSWATDGHKWLNVPYDCGIALIAHPDPHRAAMSARASYLVHDSEARDELDWNPDFSRRARGFALYAGLRELGREGIGELVARTARLAARLVAEIGALPGGEVLSPASVNQGLVRFLDPGGDHDARTDAVVAAIQREGTAWMGATTWNGLRAMRISVCNWQTTDRDVDLTVEAVRRVLRGLA